MVCVLPRGRKARAVSRQNAVCEKGKTGMNTLIGTFTECSRSLSFPGCGKKKIFCDSRETAAHCVIPFGNFKADFVFMLRGAAPGLRNLLSVRLLQTGESPLCLSLSAAALRVFPDRYISYDYPYVATCEQLTDAFSELGESFTRILPGLSEYMANAANRKKLFADAAKEVNESFKNDLFVYESGEYTVAEEMEGYDAERAMQYFERMKTARRFLPPFTEFYFGRTGRALEGLGGYAQGDDDVRRLLDVPEDRIFFTSLQKQLFLLSRKSNRFSALPKIFLSFVLAELLVCIPSALIFSTLYLFSAGVFDRATIFSTAMSEGQIQFLAVPVLLSGLIFLCFDQSIIYRLLYPKKQYKSYAAMAHPLERRLFKGLGTVLLTVFVTLTLLMGNMTVRFEENRFANGTNFFTYGQTFYLYEQIEKAAWVDRRVVSGGRTVEGTNMVFEMSDGTVIDFYAYASKEKMEKEVAPLLLKKGIEIGHFETLEEFSAS